MIRILHLFTATLLLASLASAADYPTVIRIGYPGVANDNYSPVGTATAGTLAGKGILEDEFKKEGIKIEWTFFKGAGPALNEALANGLLDFAAGLGDLPAIVHRAGGITTEVLAVNYRGQTTYIVVPNDSPAKELTDLKGKKIAIFKGTNVSLSWAKILKDQGVQESDFRTLNLDAGTSRSAIATRDVDAYVGGNDVFQLRNRGVGKIIYGTPGRSPFLGRFSTLNVVDTFEKKYPDVVQRFVNDWVKEAAWGSKEENRIDVFRWWSKNGQSWQDYKEDLGSDTLASHLSPLLDAHFYSHFTSGIKVSLDNKLIRQPFEVKDWVNDTYLKKALKEQGLETFWSTYDDGGKLAVKGVVQ